MNEIFDLNKLPERRLGVRKMIAIDRRMHIGQAISIVKREMAMQLATKILEGDTFFFERAGLAGPCSTLEYGADCIVLTREEYAAVQRQSFTEGIQHASGVTPQAF